jgi:hypothetical protein
LDKRVEVESWRLSIPEKGCAIGPCAKLVHDFGSGTSPLRIDVLQIPKTIPNQQRRLVLYVILKTTLASLVKLQPDFTSTSDRSNLSA